MSFNIEEFFNSIDVIVEQRLADLSYDTTVIATITDDSDKERGHYVVTDGTIRFDAYVNDMNYKTGDQVRVTIMNGDWSQKKFIVGLYTDNGTGQAVTYIPPLGNVFATDFSKTTASLNSNTSFTLYANNAETYKPIWGKQITKDSSEYILQANGVYNVITLSGDFQTNLGALSAGGYGLKLELYIQPEVDSTERIMKFVTFDSDEMIGNPYSFVIDSRQDKQFAIAEQGIVTEIILSVYQGVRYDDDNNSIDNSFYDKDGNKLFNSGTDYPIHFRNISVGFGSNLTEIEDKTLKIYTTNSTTYKWNNGGGDETNDKRLGLVWYNKDELDGYVGFSDGIYDPDYDEIAYLKESYADTRLTRNANKGNIADDELSLTLAANIEDSEPYMQNAYKALTTDLTAELQALGRQLTGWQTLQTELNKFISAWKESGKDTDNPALLSDARNKAETAVENLAALYYDVLQHGYNLQNDGYKNETERSEAWNKITFNDYYTEFKNSVENVLTQLETFFTTMKSQTEVGQAMSGYRTVYSNYYNRAKIVMNAIKLDLSNVIHKSKVYGQEKDDYVWLQGFNTRTDEFPSYVKDEEYFATFANRYCIYWYRYNEKYDLQYIIPLTSEEWNALSDEQKKHSSYAEYVAACNKNNDEYQFGQFLGKGWERVQVDSSANSILNFGLPEAGDTIDGVQYLKASSPTELLLYRRMEPTTEVEKYQVVLFYNHEMCKSNTLTFTNLQASEIPPEFAVDAADILRIEHDTYSQDHYQAYTQANDLVNVADESRIRQLKCYYEGVLCGDEALAGADIFWYIPTNSTMLTYNRKYLIDKGFSTDDVEEDGDGNTGKTAHSKNGYVYFSKTIGYTNTPTEVKDSEGNIIYDATGNAITEDNITINEPDKYFFYKIKPYYEAAAQNNTILVEAHIKKGEETKITTGEIPFTFSTFGTNGTKYTLVMVPNTTQISTFPHSDINPNPNLTLELSLRDADNKLIPLNEASVVVPNSIGGEVDEGDTPAIETYNLQLSWRTHNAALQNSGLTLTPVGEDKTIYTITIPNPTFGTTNVPYMGVLNASIMFNEELSNGESRQIRLKTFYPVSYSSAVEADYYISGPTTIVYDNQGVVSRLTDEPYRLYQHTLDEGDIEVTNCTWELAYFKANGSQLVEGNTEESKKTYKELIAYMPKLNADNTLMPAPMYCALYDEDGKETFVVPVAVCKINGNVVWTQPITIAQNNYASSTLNEWNGEFEINESNGTILSTMVGAGRKNVDNQFEGVLMGDIERGANFDTDNASGLGIYGFHNGAQSFYFGIDGKAFLGKAGRGRINFDGESGTISSASYQAQRVKNADGTYENHETAGMLIDLDDGIIDMKGTSYDGTYYNPKIAKLSAEEYAELWEGEPEGSYPTYAEYEAQYEADATDIARKQTHIRLDVKGTAQDGYFYIHSSKQHLPNKHLMFIGDDEYYLQTDDYDTTEFNYSDGGSAGDGKGFKLDLANSLLNAYKLKVTSKNLYLNSTSHTVDPYFVIKHDEDYDDEGNPTEKHYKNLMYVGSNNYYLQSANYIPMSNSHMGQGMRLDLAGNSPKITAYNFDLRAGNTGYGDHEIILSDSGSPYFRVNTAFNNATKTLVEISTTEQYFQSSDYAAPDSTAGTTGAGIRISLSGKELKAYSGFTLQAYQNGSDSNYILINANANDYPLRVHGVGTTTDSEGNTVPETRDFQVNWNGALEATGATITGTINATAGTFSGKLNVTGELSGGTIRGANIYAAALYAGNSNSGTTSGYQLEATASGVTIKGADIYGGNSADGGGPYYGLSPQGVLTGRSATLDDLTVNNTLNMVGKMWIGANSSSTIASQTRQLLLGGDAQVNGNLYMGIGTGTGDIVSSNTNNNRISFNGGIWVYGEKTALYAANTWIGHNGNMNSGGVDLTNSANVYLNGYCYLNGKTYIKGKTGIATTPDDNYDLNIAGKTKIGGQLSVVVDSQTYGAYASGSIATFKVGTVRVRNLTFANGLLVKVTNNAGTEITTDEADVIIPSLEGNAGKVLTVKDNDTMEWTYIKKKFNITMTGTLSNSFYTKSTSSYKTYFTGANCGTVYAWSDGEGGVVLTTSNSNPNSKVYTSAGSRKPSAWGTGGTNIYDDVSVGVISYTVTGTSGEITLDGGSDTDGSIDISISGASLTID